MVGWRGVIWRWRCALQWRRWRSGSSSPSTSLGDDGDGGDVGAPDLPHLHSPGTRRGRAGDQGDKPGVTVRTPAIIMKTTLIIINVGFSYQELCNYICEEQVSHLWRTQQKMMLTRETLSTMMMLRSRLKMSSTDL